jgi:glutaredoxin
LTKDYFRTAGIDFFDYNITDNKTYEKELLEASGELITPVVIFDGRVIVGFQPDVYTMLIARSDALDKDRQDAASE